MKLSDTILLGHDDRQSGELGVNVMPVKMLVKKLFSATASEGRLLAASPAAWRDQWLVSERFILRSIHMNAVAAPKAVQPYGIYASGLTEEPIVVELNKQKLGHTFRGVGPKVIVVHGAERFLAAMQRGEHKIKAWVGIQAAVAMGLIQADHQMSTDELYNAINEELRRKYPPRMNAISTMVPNSGGAYTTVVYPFENYFIYQLAEKTYRQAYTIAPDRTISFDGPRTEVKREYVDASAVEKQLAVMALQGCGCTDVAAEDEQVETNNLPYVMGKGKKKALKAGGPGSGPQQGQKLKMMQDSIYDHGFKFTQNSGTASIYRRPDKYQVTLHDDGTWKHVFNPEAGGRVKSGRGLIALTKHLKTYHVPNK